VFRRDAIGALLYVSNWWQLWFGQSYFEAALRPPLLRHLWSLAVEEQFYVIWPIAMLLIVRLRRQVATALLLCAATASAALMMVVNHSAVDGTRAYVGTDTRAFGLLIGAALAMALAAFPGALHRRWLPFVGVIGLALIGWCSWSLSAETSWMFPWGFLLIDSATVFALLGLLGVSSWFRAALGNPVLRWLGTRSYGLYLFHWPIFQLMRPRVDLDAAWWVNPARVMLSLVAAELCYRLVERPFHVHGLSGLRLALGKRLVPALTSCTLAIGVIVIGLVTTNSADPEVDLGSDTSRDALALSTRVTTFGSAGEGESSFAPSVTQSTITGTIPVGGSASAVTSMAGSTTSTIAPEAARIIAIGDSVMLGATRQLKRSFGQQIEIDAVESRSWFKAPEELNRFNVVADPPKVVIFHLGNNGAPEQETFRQTLAIAKNVPVIVVVTVNVPRRWESTTNSRLNSIIKLRPDIRIADWSSLSRGNRGWFERDGFHMTEKGANAYTELIRTTLAGVVPSVAPTDPPSASPTTSTTTTTTTSTLPIPTTEAITTSSTTTSSAVPLTTLRKPKATAPIAPVPTNTPTVPAPLTAAPPPTAQPSPTATLPATSAPTAPVASPEPTSPPPSEPGPAVG
jgi:Acyltransferase family